MYVRKYNSAIYKAAGSLVTGHSLQNGKKCRRQERPLRHRSPIHCLMNFQELYPSNYGPAGSREVGGFANSTQAEDR